MLKLETRFYKNNLMEFENQFKLFAFVDRRPLATRLHFLNVSKWASHFSIFLNVFYWSKMLETLTFP